MITLGLIATAFSKLYLYITRFGLTPKRIYAAWFMVILAVVFLLIILKQFVLRFRLIPTATLVCVALFGALALSGTDGVIARHNVDRYLDGSLKTVDVEAMEDLGDAAIPELVRLAKALDRANGTDISEFRYDVADFYDNYLYNRVGYALLNAADREPHTFYSFTLPRYRAEAALKSAGIRKDEQSTPEDVVDTTVLSFTYDEEIYEYDPDARRDGFVNITPAECDTIEAAVARARKECTFAVDSIRVYRDVENEMWEVDFYSESKGEGIDVFLGYDGITRLIVVY